MQTNCMIWEILFSDIDLNIFKNKRKNVMPRYRKKKYFMEWYSLKLHSDVNYIFEQLHCNSNDYGNLWFLYFLMLNSSLQSLFVSPCPKGPCFSFFFIFVRSGSYVPFPSGGGGSSAAAGRGRHQANLDTGYYTVCPLQRWRRSAPAPARRMPQPHPRALAWSTLDPARQKNEEKQ